MRPKKRRCSMPWSLNRACWMEAELTRFWLPGNIIGSMIAPGRWFTALTEKIDIINFYRFNCSEFVVS